MLLNNEFLKKYGISGNGLKIFALITMIIDHTGAVLFPQYRIMRYIGRLAFPIYCFLIVEGAVHTRNILQYGIRLMLFAIISEIPFDLAIHRTLLEYNEQNVFFTLAIGLAVVYCAMITADMTAGLIGCFLGMGLALLLKTDYTAYGIMMIYCFYCFRAKPILLTVFIGLINFVMGIGGTGSQKFAVLAMIPILLYSGKKSYGKAGEKNQSEFVKYLFYIMYPLHLLILFFVKINL